MSTNMKTIRFAGVAAAACLGLMAAGCQKQKSNEGTAPAAGEPAAPKTLTIWWAQWAPADGLQALAEEFGRKENVTVKVHQIPWCSFQDQVFQEFGKAKPTSTSSSATASGSGAARPRGSTSISPTGCRARWT